MGLTPLCPQLLRHFEITIENIGKPMIEEAVMFFSFTDLNVRLKSRHSAGKMDGLEVKKQSVALSQASDSV